MIESIRGLLDMFRKEEAPDQEIVGAFRRTFTSQDGKKVLGFLLADMHFFDEIVASEEERVLQNYARRLLAYCGAWRGQNVPLIVEALMGLPAETQTSKRKGDIV